jgi:hypothetical protein
LRRRLVRLTEWPSLRTTTATSASLFVHHLPFRPLCLFALQLLFALSLDARTRLLGAPSRCLRRLLGRRLFRFCLGFSGKPLISLLLQRVGFVRV